jgi:GrpB-like predicted nucleotidyltransferase (UPF0157 family)
MLIQKYQSSWVSDFNAIKSVIEESLTDLDFSIEHIGSTSVKDLAAKAIIDIDVVFYKKEAFETVKIRLEKLGYYHNGNQGIEGREAFKRDQLKTKHLVLDSIIHHLYVCPADSPELQRHLAFRDFLRAHEKERKEYEHLKYEIALKTNQDKKEYAILKEEMAKEFIESILQKAKIIKSKNKYSMN